MKAIIVLNLLLCSIFMLPHSLSAMNPPKNVDSLTQEIKRLIQEHSIEEAFQLNEQLDSLVLLKADKRSKAYEEVCYYYGELYRMSQDYPLSLKYYKEATDIYMQINEADSFRYADLLYKIGWVSNQLNKFDESINYFERSFRIFDQAEEIDEESRLIFIGCLSSLGGRYLDKNKFEQAEMCYKRGLSLTTKYLPKTSSRHLGQLINLGNLYREVLQYKKAEELLLAAKHIYENEGGDLSHAYYTYGLSNLGILYAEMTAYEKAETLFLKVKSIDEKKYGKDHPMSIHNVLYLGTLYSSIANYDLAESSYLTVRDWCEEKGIKSFSGLYFTCISNLSNLYLSTNRPNEALQVSLKGLEQVEQILGKDNPFYLPYLNLIGLGYSNARDFELARKYQLQHLEGTKSLKGVRNFDYCGGLVNMGNICYFTGQLEDSEAYFLEAKDIFVSHLNNKRHRFYLECLHSLGRLYLLQKNYTKLIPVFKEMKAYSDLHINKSLHHLSEEELQQYLQFFSLMQVQTYNAAQLNDGVDGELAAISYDLVLYFKGFLLHGINQNRRLAINDESSKTKLESLKTYQRLLAREYTKPATMRDSQLMVDLKEKSKAIEKQFKKTIAGYSASSQQITWQEVQQQLGEGEVAIEFIDYQLINDDLTDSIMYAAMLIRPGDTNPLFVSLFEQNELKQILNQGIGDKADKINNLYQVNTEASLCQLFKPFFDQYLDGIKTVYYSPAGLLHRVNMAAIQNTQGLSFQHNVKMVRLNSTRELVLDTDIEGHQNNALLIGGLKYDMDSLAMCADNEFPEVGISRGMPTELHFEKDDELNALWPYLDWTEVEVQAVGAMLEQENISVSIKDGFKGSEDMFRTISTPSPRIIHLATHGFFFDNQSADIYSTTDFVGATTFKMSQHPMIRSGLIMSGANHTWQHGQTLKSDMEDGILTAYEISQMDLSNTELVVLSACETALGDIEGNEGVYGLQRAFKIAGVKYLIMSLWQVPDYQTQQLMKAFYQNWLSEKLSIPDAFRLAQKQMEKKYQDPYLWAGFILVE